jgi:hypothetical protein
MILTGMLAMTLCGASESTASPGLSLTITPASPGGTAVATVALSDVADIESFSLELSLGSGTTLQLPAGNDWFTRGAYFPVSPFGAVPTVELNNSFESTARTKVYIDGFKPTGTTGTIGTVSFTVSPSAVVGDAQDIVLSGVYYSLAGQSELAFAPATAHFVTVISQTRNLTVTFAGTGSGTVTSNPSGLACNISTTKAYDSGSVLTLHSEPGAFSLFSGWSGEGCSGLNDCPITMNSDKTVTTTFAKDVAHQVRLDGIAPTYYSTIMSAMGNAATGNTIKAWGTDFTENISLNSNKSLIIKGGYDNIDYSTNTGNTVIKGTLKISNGTLKVEKLIIR